MTDWSKLAHILLKLSTAQAAIVRLLLTGYCVVGDEDEHSMQCKVLHQAFSSLCACQLNDA